MFIMFKWITAQFRKANSTNSPKVSETKYHLTKQERLQSILISYKTGKISLETAVNLIYVWHLVRNDK